ncbi:M48 family metallopeptidase [Thalassotalea sp. M1531]|uniref:M48 family metallopeptidase n=2 Tax=Thalassotalea algicola TaxID=2716224 RepID=A0A7Y0LD22_9GAMM|nr:M48 family metallopeptidase [Thalassotalea algicola]
MKKYLSVIAACVLVSACSTSSTGRQQLTLFSSGELNKMGVSSFEQLKEKEKINRDKRTNEYVKCISTDIVKQISSTSDIKNWEVVVFESEQVNAFALPGKKIGVYTGILKVAETPDQLAAIIGHEVGHVLERHSNERMSSGQLAQIGMQVADAALASQNVQYRNAWMAGLGLGVQYGVLMPYGRTHESEADIVGQKLMAKAGYNPEAAIQLWRNMAKVSKGAPPEFLSTHPSSQTRIKQLTNNLPNVQGSYRNANKATCKK